jgi:hypothetical protein
MLRHRALHERPEVRPRKLVKRPASPEPGPFNSPPKRPLIHNPQSSSLLNLIYYQRTRKPEYYI